MFSRQRRKSYPTRGYFDDLPYYGISIKRRCQLLGVHRSVTYCKPKPVDSLALERENQIKKRMDYWRTIMPYLGSRKLQKKLCDKDNLHVGRKLVRRYMAEMGIRAIYPNPNLSKADNGQQKHPYLLKNKAIYLPNQVWAVDITYIPIRHGHMYLTAVIDWHSRYIIGWTLSETLETANVLQAISIAIELYGAPAIINSDQGSQFTIADYRQLLKRQGVRQSMDGKARWVDNVIIERWFRSLKVEYVYINDYNSPRDLRVGILEYVDTYNRLRPHQGLDYKTPGAVYFSSFANQAAS